MKKLLFILSLAASTILFNTMSRADTFYIGTGTPVTSKYNASGANVSGTITDANKDGYADGRAGSSGKHEDPTNTRDANWTVIYTDVFASEYKARFEKGDSSEFNARLSAVEYELSQLGNTEYGYVDAWKDYGATGHSKKYMGSTNTRASGVVYGSTADLFSTSGIGWNQGGLSNFSDNGSGVITTYGGGYFDEAGQYTYNPDHTIDYIGHNDLLTSGFTPVQSGIVAFITGFDMKAGFNYINGSFSVMGELLGIYLNGVLLSNNLYYLSDDLVSEGYAYTGQYNLEIDLTNSSVAALLNASGNNNIAFMVAGIPHKYTGTDSYVYNDSMSFIALSADIVQNTNPLVPEPATFLLWAFGSLGALGYYGKRRRQK
ncbi:MAG: PEP-CTERM sorting domain-containing protein [Planctomycetaceae bacterium]|nr:PEP-CTERM sorting domain-containing protein [Planctomycetaceae bacterium]